MDLIFKSSEIARCIEHALASKDWRVIQSELGPIPSICLVHDTGVYITSNGKPIDWIPEKETCYLAYAKGCDPIKDEYYYETGRELVGSKDDFVNVIPITEEWRNDVCKYKEFHIELTPDDIIYFFKNP